MARIRSIKPEFWKKDSEAWGSARGHLYLVQEGDDGPVKVGVAAHPTRRLATLQCGNPRKLVLKAVWEGTERSCCEVERLALRYCGASGSEWVYQPLDEVVGFVTAFEEPEQ